MDNYKKRVEIEVSGYNPKTMQSETQTVVDRADDELFAAFNALHRQDRLHWDEKLYQVIDRDLVIDSDNWTITIVLTVYDFSDTTHHG